MQIKLDDNNQVNLDYRAPNGDQCYICERQLPSYKMGDGTMLVCKECEPFFEGFKKFFNQIHELEIIRMFNKIDSEGFTMKLTVLNIRIYKHLKTMPHYKETGKYQREKEVIDEL